MVLTYETANKELQASEKLVVDHSVYKNCQFFTLHPAEGSSSFSLSLKRKEVCPSVSSFAYKIMRA